MPALPTDLASRLLLEVPNFKLYAICVGLLAAKMYAVTTLTVRARMRTKASTNIEDSAVLPGNTLSVHEHPDVARIQRMHRNDVENIPVFFILGLLAVLTGAPALPTQLALIAFTAFRFVYTGTYLAGVQPWRTISFFLAMLANLALVVLIGSAVL